ncbi:hypothetical protein Barba22A_gp051 [Rheinheimera phage vB_RspM_Barba22A]|jgi:hypothetical protein|uniref:Antirestriction protein n=78 Tax=Barbavirus TaxID=2733095 RepID=A0A7G9VRS4_9CAUD|nr:hypothetical protein HOV45_gp052 [Rheinheimera phage Barba8S]YP_009822928.1 hypothetical protein HOV46_gp051 [Rheinheimera phage vB_RspM_Barba18A]QCQ57902.1 hypothetical protein Barba1A_gp051 [Rheinheimera phage vB_RspM_Barba1A]QCQ58038.1 hypothetical protein Barba1S_gp051 [Rheinheimera phage vB_RspM_Barba1S]QCQ58310.1 hypothetical protein Barba2S_gp051 [Rheinheimera phage vB_RspM_Barba2S]QCQ58446.1 hypothetical protein Barba3A_gp052 [Rheinheimera phage vB_RspM_Barba3A]QCQ58584.1 hypotheti
MNYSTIKTVKSFCEGLHSEPCFREVITEIESGSFDFEVNNVRFIKDDSILEIMAEEIFNGDDYVLGCFNAHFIADNSNLNYELVKAYQELEAFEAIGKALNDTLSDSEKESFCEQYASADGYGYHFNRYDGNCEEIHINGELWLVFDNR